MAVEPRTAFPEAGDDERRFASADFPDRLCRRLFVCEPPTFGSVFQSRAVWIADSKPLGLVAPDSGLQRLERISIHRRVARAFVGAWTIYSRPGRAASGPAK